MWDATDDPCHGQQELEFFNAYCDTHCFLPLYLHVTAEDGRQRLMGTLLRPGKCAATLGLFSVLRRAVHLLRARFPAVKIVLRADSGFGCDATLRFCDMMGLGYVLGLSKQNGDAAEGLTPQELQDLCAFHGVPQRIF